LNFILEEKALQKIRKRIVEENILVLSKATPYAVWGKANGIGHGFSPVSSAILPFHIHPLTLLL
jgi:hypothetical protein